jgi:predicted phosphodiesterase
VLFFNPGTACGYTSSGTHSIGMLHIGEQIQGEIIQI